MNQNNTASSGNPHLLNNMSLQRINVDNTVSVGNPILRKSNSPPPVEKTAPFLATTGISHDFASLKNNMENAIKNILSDLEQIDKMVDSYLPKNMPTISANRNSTTVPIKTGNIVNLDIHLGQITNYLNEMDGMLLHYKKEEISANKHLANMKDSIRFHNISIFLDLNCLQLEMVEYKSEDKPDKRIIISVKLTSLRLIRNNCENIRSHISGIQNKLPDLLNLFNQHSSVPTVNVSNTNNNDDPRIKHMFDIIIGIINKYLPSESDFRPIPGQSCFVRQEDLAEIRQKISFVANLKEKSIIQPATTLPKINGSVIAVSDCSIITPDSVFTSNTSEKMEGVLIHQCVLANLKNQLVKINSMIENAENNVIPDPMFVGLRSMGLESGEFLHLLRNFGSEIDKQPFINARNTDVRLLVEKEITKREIEKLKLQLEMEKIRSEREKRKIDRVEEPAEEKRKMDQIEDSDEEKESSRPLKKRKLQKD